MNIQVVELKEIEFVEVDGEFEQRFVNAKKYPAFLTNASIKRGYDSGLLESSLFEDLLKLKGLETLVNAANEDEETALEIMSAFDEQKLISLIYLGVIGANRNLQMTLDDFLELYHLSFGETIQLYANLIMSFIGGSNDFAKGLNAATKKKKHQRKAQN